MNFFRSKGILILFVVLFQGCISKNLIPVPIPNQLIDLKIGVIADTQITTPYRTSSYLFRNMKIDSLVNVAVRTSAQEHLAAEHLRYMLVRMASESPDFIVYLGDAANSGCADELMMFMDTVHSFRDEYSIPIFLTIGNHDYLATGNQADSRARVQACGSKDYFTKFRLSKLFSNFNVESSKIKIPGEKYQISSFADVFTKANKKNITACSVSEEEQHVSGCFYSGLIEIVAENKPPVSVLLVDTSDYKDVNILPKVSEYFSFFGLRGSISWNAGQTDWFESLIDDSKKTRIIASHYPVSDLGWIRYFMGRPGDLMSKDGYNLWLSAHTHVKDIKKEEGVGLRYGNRKDGYKTVQHLNVGSTIDYRPHAGIVELNSDLVKMKTILSMTEAELDSCKGALYAAFDESPNEVEANLGLTRAYRKAGYDTKLSRNNIDEFLAAQGTLKRGYWVRCLVGVAAENENG